MWFLINFISFFLFEYLLIIIHEFGHAAAARLVGFRVFSLTIGYGKKIFEVILFGVPVTLNALPFIGLTTALPQKPNQMRLRLWLYSSAGIATHIFFLMSAYVYSPDSFYLGYVVPKVLTQFAPLESFIIANLVLFPSLQS